MTGESSWDMKMAHVRSVREEYRRQMNVHGQLAASAMEEEDWFEAAVRSAEAARMETAFSALTRVVTLLEMS